MFRFTLGALLGALAFQQLTAIPPLIWSLPIAGLFAVALRRRAILLSGFAGLFCWAHFYAFLTAPSAFIEFAPRQTLVVHGAISSLVDRNYKRTRFVFRAREIERPDGSVRRGDWRIQLSWYSVAPENLRPDQQWRLHLRLRPAHGYANPGSFDYEGWLYRRGIALTGYVRPEGGRCTARCGEGVYSLTGVRHYLSSRIVDRLGGGDGASVLRALVVGDRSGMGPELWARFRATGTSHLMAISGLHIGLVAGAVGGLVMFLWRRVPRLCRRWPARLAGGLAGLGAALAYAALAGFTVPTQRALIMLAVLVVALAARREMRPLKVFAIALLLVLLRDPGAVSESGFWLSFGAVAVIVLATSSEPPLQGWRSVLRIQVAITLGLAPLLFAQGFPFSVSGLLVNPLVVPVFGLAVVPAAIAGALLLVSGLDPHGFLLVAAAWMIEQVLWLLAWFTEFEHGVFQLPEPGLLSLLLSLCGMTLLLLPRGVPARPIGVLLLLPLLLGVPRHQSLRDGDFRVTVLDVGQGLSVVVETRRRVLVFDSGPAFRSGFETGSTVVAPFLRYQGWHTMDRLILSHADRDHAGGTDGLLGLVPADVILAGEAPEQALEVSGACHRGLSWNWDKVDFSLLHPAEGDTTTGNTASCVLRIANRTGALLLTGDIEVHAERIMLAHYAGTSTLQSRVVVAPHHGSRTSSTFELVQATRPDFVVFTTGFRNAYGFPAADVEQRWHQAGARLVDTADSGAVQFEFKASGELRGPFEYREQNRRYWHYKEN